MLKEGVGTLLEEEVSKMNILGAVGIMVEGFVTLVEMNIGAGVNFQVEVEVQ